MTKPLAKSPPSPAADKRLPKGYPTIAIARVIPYARNARTHSDAQVADLAGIIQEFGFRMPIGISFDEGSEGNVRLWAGHGRVLAAAKLGMTDVPYVDWSDLTDGQKRALALADNKIALNAGWDEDILGLELTDLKSLGVDIDMLGFNEAELNNLLAAEDGEASENDPVGEPPANPVSRVGDTWQLGTHVLRCGDSTNPADVAELLGVEKPFLMVADPPYGVEYDPGWRNKLIRVDGSKVVVENMGEVKNDGIVDWSAAWKLFPGDVAYVWHSSKFVGDVERSLIAARFEIRAQIIWNKGRIVPGRGNYHYQHEPCWYAVRNGKAGRWNGDRTQSTVWDIPILSGFQSKLKTADDEHTEHSTQKPVECMLRPMLNNSSKGDAVYDPFLGSGSTLMAAEKSGRRCYGMELFPPYVDIIIGRWQKATGRKATLMGSTKTFDDVRAERLGSSSSPSS